MNTIGVNFRVWLCFIVFILSALFFFGVIDEPEFKSKLQGRVEQCIQASSRYTYGGKINCTAVLENGYLVHFSSFYMLKSGDIVIYVEYERPLTGLKSYGRIQ